MQIIALTWADHQAIMQLGLDAPVVHRIQVNIHIMQFYVTNVANHFDGILDGAGGSSGAGAADRDSFSRWRDRQYYGPRRWFQNSRDETQWEKDNGKFHLIIIFVSFILFNLYLFTNQIQRKRIHHLDYLYGYRTTWSSGQSAIRPFVSHRLPLCTRNS